jgi:hypothetical protein
MSQQTALLDQIHRQFAALGLFPPSAAASDNQG